MEIRSVLSYCFILLLSQISCSSEQAENVSESKAGIGNFIVLSKEQIAQAEIHSSEIAKQLISEKISCTGSIEADPNQQALVSPTMKGYLKSINVHVGDYVKRGQKLAVLTHPDYIKLQQEYFETLSQYNYFEQDFKRQGELSLENAASLKTMQLAQNEFNKTEARLFSLKKQLSFLGINADSLHVDNIQSSIGLPAPIEGFVTKTDGQIGMLCPEEIPIFHIVGSKNLLLELKVFEKDAQKIKSGQNFEFSILSGADKKYSAQIKTVARALDKSNTISVHAHIGAQSKELMPGMFVKASIQTNADSVWAVTEEALVKHENKEYIFQPTEQGYKPIRVTSGMKADGWIEIDFDEPEITKSKFVSQGAYYILSEWIGEE